MAMIRMASRPSRKRIMKAPKGICQDELSLEERKYLPMDAVRDFTSSTLPSLRDCLSLMKSISIRLASTIRFSRGSTYRAYRPLRMDRASANLPPEAALSTMERVWRIMEIVSPIPGLLRMKATSSVFRPSSDM